MAVFIGEEATVDSIRDCAVMGAFEAQSRERVAGPRPLLRRIVVHMAI
jgi:hypothetical protein